MTNHILIFDTETTGIPANYKAPVTDTNNWPRMVQLAYQVFDKQGNKIASKNFIIKPDGYTIPAGASNIHGITTERAIAEGQDLVQVLKELAADLAQTSVIVAHNLAFDEKIVGAEFVRTQIPNNLFQIMPRICTMQSSTQYCKISGKFGYKWPTLSELHIHLFGKDFEDAHDAANDVDACAKCFFELVQRKVIVI